MYHYVDAMNVGSFQDLYKYDVNCNKVSIVKLLSYCYHLYNLRIYLRHWWQRSRTGQTQIQGDSQIFRADNQYRRTSRADLIYPRQPQNPLETTPNQNKSKTQLLLLKH